MNFMCCASTSSSTGTVNGPELKKITQCYKDSPEHQSSHSHKIILWLSFRSIGQFSKHTSRQVTLSLPNLYPLFVNFILTCTSLFPDARTPSKTEAINASLRDLTKGLQRF